MGGGGEAAAPHFLHIYYGPSVACTVGCTWLMYSLCMAHIWPMYDLHMARRAPRDLSPLIYRTVVDCTVCYPLYRQSHTPKRPYGAGG